MVVLPLSPRESSRRSKLRLVAGLLPVVLAGCLPVGDSAVPEATRAIEMAEVFETTEPFSRRTLDPADLVEFFARYPDHQADSAEVGAFYRRRGMQFAWFVGDSLSAGADAFLALSGAAEAGAVGADSSLAHLASLLSPPVGEAPSQISCDSCAVHLELHLTVEFFRFADRHYNGYFRRDLRELGWFIPRAKKDLSRLADSLAAGTMELAAYEPLHPQYQKLKAHLPSYHALAEEPWPALALPGQRSRINPGDSLAVVAEIRRRLQQLGDLVQADSSGRYDSTLVPAVRRFQARHGLSEDGVIGPAVLRALNVPPAERLRTMLVNMERLRWVPDEQPPNLLLVNIPEFRLHVYEGGEEVLGMRVVVGTAARSTVVFADTVSMVVFSPTWTVPREIIEEEILPALAADPGYLAKQNMEIIGGTPEQPLIRQRPGANNALGRVKFLFPNSYAIYMHDTPERQLFARDQRAFSHGCIRLAEPRALAEYLLRRDATWTQERMTAAMQGGTETLVPLADRPPVMIVYFTAWEDRDGRLNFRDDVYGHDQRLAAELFR